MKLNKGYLVYVTILGFFILRYWEYLFTNRTFGGFVDGTYLLPTAFSYISQHSSLFTTPYWIKGMIGGMQIFDSPMMSITYPLYFFKLINYGIGYSAQIISTKITLLHFLILQINTYILARTIGISKIGGLASAILIITYTNFATYAGWIIMVAAYSWFPLYIAGLYSIFNSPYNKKGILMITIACYGFIANPAQPIIHAFYLGVIIVISGLIKHRAHAKQIILNLIGSLALILGLTSASIIPILMNTPEMIRWVGKGSSVVGNEKLPFEAFHATIPLEAISEFVVNNAHWKYGPGHHYIGFISLALIIISLISIKKLKNSWIFYILIGFGVYGILSAFGHITGFVNINYKIPLIDKIREPIRHLIYFSFAASILSGLGVQYLVSNITHNKLFKILFCIVSAAILYGLYLDTNNDWVLYMLPIVALSLAGLFINRLDTKMVIAISLILLCITNGLITRRAVSTHPERSTFYKTENIQSHKILELILEKEQNNEFRLVFEAPELFDGSWAMNALYYDLRSFQTQFVPQIYQQWKEFRHKDQFYNYRSIGAGKYYIFSKKNLPTEQHFQATNIETELYKVYENKNAYPMIYSADRVQYINCLLDKCIPIVNKSKYLKNKIYTHPDNKSNIHSYINNKAIQIEYNRPNHNSIEINTNSDSNKFLVINEYLSKYWRITVNGDRIKPIKVNVNQIGVKLNKGSNEINLSYRPLLFIILHYLQYATILIILIGLLMHFTSRNNLIQND